MRILALAVFLAACGTSDDTGGSRPVDPSRPIVFLDSDVFDVDLARSLAIAPDSVSVTAAAPMNVNAVPPRLNAWMAAVQSRGGAVRLVRRDPGAAQQQQFFGLLLPIVGPALAALFPDKADVRQYMRESRTYARAEGYDMRVVYSAGSGQIEEIVFERKT
jgi:hypothetical protein